MSCPVKQMELFMPPAAEHKLSALRLHVPLACSNAVMQSRAGNVAMLFAAHWVGSYFSHKNPTAAAAAAEAAAAAGTWGSIAAISNNTDVWLSKN